MQYLLLIYDSEQTISAMSEAETKQFSADYMTFTKEIIASGHFKAGDALQPVHTATTVRVRDGKPVITDGPFAETREQLGGYYMLEAKDLNEAIQIAAKIPGAKTGSVEVRPIMEIPDSVLSENAAAVLSA